MSIHHSAQHKPTRARRGSAVMEAALVFPMLLALTFGSIEFGYYFFTKHTFQGAAREGARRAIVPGETNANVTSTVAQAMTAAGFAPGSYTVAIRNAGDTANVDVATAAAGTGILVKVSTPWSSIRVMTPYRLGDSSNGQPRLVMGQTVMRKEG